MSKGLLLVTVVLLGLVVASTAIDASTNTNARLRRRTTTSKNGELALTDEENLFKQTVFERTKDTKVDDEEKRIDDPAPEGGSAIVVDNHNSLNVADSPLDKQKFEEAFKSQQSEQTNKDNSEQQLKKNNAQGRAQEKIANDKYVADLKTNAANEQGQKVQLNDAVEKGILKDKVWRLQKSQKLAEANKLQFNGQYTWMFWIRPIQTVGNYANIFHKGQENVNRNPAVWFYPGSTRLHVRSGVNQDPTWENGGNYGCDPERTLPLGQWTHVAFTHKSGEMKVYLNGDEACAANIAAPVANTGPLYGTDPWHDAAIADMADLRYLPRVVELSDIKTAVKERRGI